MTIGVVLRGNDNFHTHPSFGNAVIRSGENCRGKCRDKRLPTTHDLLWSHWCWTWPFRPQHNRRLWIPICFTDMQRRAVMNCRSASSVSTKLVDFLQKLVEVQYIENWTRTQIKKFSTNITLTTLICITTHAILSNTAINSYNMLILHCPLRSSPSSKCKQLHPNSHVWYSNG